MVFASLNISSSTLSADLGFVFDPKVLGTLLHAYFSRRGSHSLVSHHSVPPNASSPGIGD